MKYIIGSLDQPVYLIKYDAEKRRSYFTDGLDAFSTHYEAQRITAEGRALRFDTMDEAKLQIFLSERSSALATALNLVVIPVPSVQQMLAL